MKKRKKIYNNCVEKSKLTKKIKKNNYNIWLPNSKIKLGYINNNTWFDINKSRNITLNEDFKLKKNKNISSKQLYKIIKVNLKFNDDQKKILNKWFLSYIKMYNEALNLIKIKLINKDDNINFFAIRKELLNIKAEIYQKYENSKTKINVHDLDLAVKLACSNVKSSLSNMKNKNIKHFRIRYWKYNKKIKILDLEKINFCDNSIRKKNFGNVKSYFNGKEFKLNNINCDSRLIYNDFNKQYILYVPIKDESKIKRQALKKNKIISLDPGLRTFMSGISESHIIKIGTNCSDKIKSYLNRIDKINNNEKISDSKKRKCEKRYNKKLGNYMDELHWKTINYLTKSYETILIGDMSSKRIVSNDNNLLSELAIA